jgi:hypothetical protein
MRHERIAMTRLFKLIAASGLMLSSLAPLSAQQKGNWTPPKTAWGEPSLEGTWTNETVTPFERPVALGTKAFYTPAEARELETRLATQREKADGAAGAAGDVGTYNQAWLDSGTKVVSTLQTSLVMDPPDGRVPTTPEAMAQKKDFDDRNGDAPEFMSPWDRCITRGVPAGFFPAGYNNAYQIYQFPGYVLIYYEMIHNARIIPTDGRAHKPAHIKLWDGDSVGRWDGNTLVVDVTNFNGKGWIGTSAATGRMRGVVQSDSAHVVERFTRADDKTIHYEVTVEDSKKYTRPWTVKVPLERDDTYVFYEYACHEGNHAVEHVLRGARASEKTGAR